ncbi:3-oxoadipate CoA-transferase subunit B [compost metagenome]
MLIPTAKRAIIWRTKHDKRTFVEKVDFVTTRGNLWKIVTNLCVFEFKNGSLHLDSIHPTSSLEEVAANTDFPLRYDEIRYTPLPTEREMSLLKQIDPFDYRAKEM